MYHGKGKLLEAHHSPMFGSHAHGE
jgi:hypothetical protein